MKKHEPAQALWKAQAAAEYGDCDLARERLKKIDPKSVDPKFYAEAVRAIRSCRVAPQLRGPRKRRKRRK